MKLLAETAMGKGNPAFIGKRQQHLTCKASTELNFTATAENEKAGMLIFQNETHFYYICKSMSKGKAVVQLFKADRSSNSMVLIKQELLAKPSDPLFLKISAEKDKYSFWFSTQENKWNLLQGGLDGKYLSTREAGGFVGSLFAMYATSEGKGSKNTAAFKWFGYSGDDETSRAK